MTATAIAPMGIFGGIMLSSFGGSGMVSAETPTERTGSALAIMGGIMTASGSAAAMSGARNGAALLIPGLTLALAGVALGGLG